MRTVRPREHRWARNSRRATNSVKTNSNNTFDLADAANAQPMHSVLHPASAQAQLVRILWWWMLGVAAVIYMIVVATMLVAAARARREAGGATSGRPPSVGSRDDVAIRWVGASALLTACVSAVFLVYNIRVGAALGRHVAQPLIIEVVGHQWWWEVTYTDSDRGNRVTTANEIHIPVGRQIAIDLRSADVIHSFWVPNLAGKQDLTPGHPARVWIEADTPGVYRGQCSQFCGLQHAQMALFVVAESRDRFDAWLQGQRRLAQAPLDSTRRRGKNVFVDARCGSCHTIEGVMAVGSFGPSLTHLASRSTIAAGTLPNSPARLAAWILNPGLFKPGTSMPSNSLSGADLQALTAYLGALK
jgi:cytochrome c oxidase subunit 2